MTDHWKRNGIEKPRQVVVCAAIKYNDLIICGARHFDKVMTSQLNSIRSHMNISNFKPLMRSYEVQGFIDQFGDFLTREEALKIVKESGQRFDENRNGSETELFSEGVY